MSADDGGQEKGTSAVEAREIQPDSKVGFSLSMCVGDIMRGTVKEEEVKEIIAGTNAPTPEKVSEVIDSYKRTYWKDNPEEGEAIARRLFEAGKVKQPRTEGKEAHNLNGGHWADADKAEEEYQKKLLSVTG